MTKRSGEGRLGRVPEETIVGESFEIPPPLRSTRVFDTTRNNIRSCPCLFSFQCQHECQHQRPRWSLSISGRICTR